MGYRFRHFEIPDYMMEPLQAYCADGLRPGSFLQAVIRNDLAEAVSRADETNQANLAAYVSYFWNVAPASCWGSEEKMEAWIARKAEERAAKESPP